MTYEQPELPFEEEPAVITGSGGLTLPPLTMAREQEDSDG